MVSESTTKTLGHWSIRYKLLALHVGRGAEAGERDTVPLQLEESWLGYPDCAPVVTRQILRPIIFWAERHGEWRPAIHCGVIHAKKGD